MIPEKPEKIAFRMTLKPGCAEQYQARHDAIWPELAALLTASGISDYRIFLDEQTGALFATLTRSAGHQMDSLPQHPIMQRWWAHMADLMLTNADGSPLVEPLPCVFYLA